MSEIDREATIPLVAESWSALLEDVAMGSCCLCL